MIRRVQELNTTDFMRKQYRQFDRDSLAKQLGDAWVRLNTPLSTGASPVKPDGSAGLSESRVTQTDPEKQLGLHDSIPAKPENTKT